MVFDVGDWVTGWGRMVADADGEWLDLARAMTLEWSDRPRPRSHHSVRLIGADFDAVPTEFGPNNAIPGTATIGGIWLGDAIEVQSQSPAGAPHQAAPEWTTPPCPPPVGDWPHGEPDHNLDFDLGDLQTSGAAVSIVIFRPSSDQAVLVVAASNVDAVETVYGHNYPIGSASCAADGPGHSSMRYTRTSTNTGTTGPWTSSAPTSTSVRSPQSTSSLSASQPHSRTGQMPSQRAY